MERIVSGRTGRASRASLGVAVVAALIFGAAAPQEKKESAKSDTPSPSEVLDRAIAAQGRPAGAAPGPLPLALYAKVNLTFEHGDGHRISIDAERKFLAPKDGPRMVWTRAVSTFDRKETQTGFDGKRPWFWSKESGVRSLTEPGTESDRKEVEADLETSELLARSFLLENLRGELKDVKRLDDETGYGKTAWVVEGDATIDRRDASGAVAKKKLKLRLYVEQKSSWLYGARVTVEGETPLQICFTEHEKVDGVVVPGKIEIYRDDEKKPWQTLRVSELRLAPKLSAKEFEPPTK